MLCVGFDQGYIFDYFSKVYLYCKYAIKIVA